MNYGEILSRAWRILWTQKTVWLFTILPLAFLFLAAWVFFQILVNSIYSLVLNTQQFIDNLILGTLSFAVLSSILVAFTMTASARTGWQSEETGTTLGFQAVVDLIRRPITTVILALIALSLAIILLGIIFFLPFQFLQPRLLDPTDQLTFVTVYLVFGTGVFCLVVPLVLLSDIFLWLTAAAAEKETLGWSAIQAAWHSGRQALAEVVIMDLLLVAVRFAVLIVVGGPFLLVIASLISQQMPGAIYNPSELVRSLLVPYLLALPFFAVLLGLAQAYTGISWGLAYRALKPDLQVDNFP